MNQPSLKYRMSLKHCNDLLDECAEFLELIQDCPENKEAIVNIIFPDENNCTKIKSMEISMYEFMNLLLDRKRTLTTRKKALVNN